MARIQILELPEGGSDDRPPFILIIDQVPDAAPYLHMVDEPERLGARAILIFKDTIEIPANDVPVGPDGYPVRLKIEGDFTKFREQAMTEIAKAQADMKASLR